MATAIEKFIAMMIVKGSKTYAEVIAARPDLKEGIDEALIETGNGHLITEGA